MCAFRKKGTGNESPRNQSPRVMPSGVKHRGNDYMLTKAVMETLEQRVLLSFTVTTLHDNNRMMAIGSTHSVLRQAIEQANAAGDGETVTFDSSLFEMALKPSISAAAGLVLDDLGGITISGPGAELLTINGCGDGSVFNVNAGSSAEIDGVTIAGGQTNGYGGGILTRAI